MKLNQAAFDMLAPLPLFSSAMRKANRAGNKSQTRRILKLPKWSTGNFADLKFQMPLEPSSLAAPIPVIKHAQTGDLKEIQCPYGYPTELRYMREPLFKGKDGFAYYLDDDGTRVTNAGLYSLSSIPSMYINAQRVTHLITGEFVKWTWKVKTLSGVYMPKYAARLFKRIQSVRVERLNVISATDCIAEGIETQGTENKDSGIAHAVLEFRYSQLWDSLNAKRGYPWASNPFVWVIGYADDQTITAAQAHREMPA